MKNGFLWLSLFIFNLTYSQNSYTETIEKERREHVLEMTTIEKGILNQEELAAYIAHDYFPVDKTFRVKSRLQKIPSEIIKMPTSSGKEKVYEVVGMVTIRLKKQPIDTLYILQDTTLQNHPLYKEYYFIPFRDLTTGNQTYGAGRYLDIKLTGKKVEIDFNKAYNPYCAFSYRYNCPIPPKCNDLNISIKAGEKTPLLND